ncbi:homeobox-like domain superfamily [Holotrichia oblita]|uniref:Homeobox-like domain superfamily n=1 Tax=Holotrichia oblita TaxID=644536 RepID=A0ACB9THN9_HOLOL|nr:homeobox-like domain superfamily [Holotrichia oblita]
MYPEDQVDYRSFTIHTTRIVERFLNTGNVAKGKSTGRPTVATPDVLNNVNERVAENPHISVCRLSQQIDAKSTVIHHNNQHQINQPTTSHNHTHVAQSQAEAASKLSANDRPFLGHTSLLPATSTGTIKSEPGYEYSCLQNQSYPYQQIFGFPSGSPNNAEVAYHHQHHVTAAAKLMASS